MASRSVSGRPRHWRSASRSVRMPPLPAISSGPNSRSRTTPITNSVPPGAIACTTTCGSPAAGDNLVVRRRHLHRVRQSNPHTADIGLVQDAGRGSLQRDRIPRRLGRPDRLGTTRRGERPGSPEPRRTAEADRPATAPTSHRPGSARGTAARRLALQRHRPAPAPVRRPAAATATRRTERHGPTRARRSPGTGTPAGDGRPQARPPARRASHRRSSRRSAPRPGSRSWRSAS